MNYFFWGQPASRHEWANIDVWDVTQHWVVPFGLCIGSIIGRWCNWWWHFPKITFFFPQNNRVEVTIKASSHSSCNLELTQNAMFCSLHGIWVCQKQHEVSLTFAFWVFFFQTQFSGNLITWIAKSSPQSKTRGQPKTGQPQFLELRLVFVLVGNLVDQKWRRVLHCEFSRSLNTLSFKTAWFPPLGAQLKTFYSTCGRAFNT